ncbi:MAG: permease-like cell division protein FtsX [Lachnospiraceae bacterium]|nr:permease-like cell division protein FtsX [Lachnospiraceae bacterium]
MSTLFYGIGQGFKSLFQNKIFTLAAIGTITACLFILGVFYTLFANFRNMVYKAESNVGLTVFFDEGLSEAQIEYLGGKIKGVDGVKKIKFVSAAEAWENFKKEKFEGNKELINTFGQDNPLKNSASYEVYLKNVANQEKVAKKIEKIDGVRKVNGSGAAASKISSFNMLIAYVSLTIIIMLILVSVFLISSAVAMGINVRKDEIAIMKLIGATDAFVRLPFIFEGVFIGIIGAAIPLGILRLFYGQVIGFIVRGFPALTKWLHFISVKDIFTILTPTCAIIGVGIGLIGSMWSLRKHLKI